MQGNATTQEEILNNRRWWPFPLTLILAAIPVLGYTFAYSYQSGYVTAFGIPPDIIRVSNLDVLRVWFPVAAIITMTVGSGPFLLLFLPVKTLPLVVRMAPLFLLIALVGTYFAIVSAGWKSWAVLCGISVVLIATQILFQKLRKNREQRDKVREPVLIDKLFSTIRAAWILTPIVIVALSIGVALMGWAYAKDKTTFIVLGEEQHSIIVLQIYDEFAITAPISVRSDGKTMVKESFTIYRLDALPGQPLKYLDVGPLVPYK